MMQKAVIVAPWFGVNSGGAEIALLKIAEGLRRLDHDVEIYTTRSQTPYGDWLENPEPRPDEHVAGFPVRRFAVEAEGLDRYRLAVATMSQGRDLTRIQRDDFFRYGMTSTDLVTALKALPADVKILGGPYYQALIHNVVAALPGRVFVMPAFHEEPPFRFEAIGRLLRDARGLLFLTETEKRMVIRTHAVSLDRNKLETPVLSLPHVNEADVGRDNRHELLRRLLDSYMIYVGRIDEGKNINQLVQWHHQASLERQKAGLKPIMLVLAGKGAGLSFESPFVRAIGFVSEEEKRALIADSLGLVNISRNESFSFVLFEAWQLNVPVIVHTDCTVMRNHIEIGKGGYSCRTAAEYAAALREFERPEMRRILAANGRGYGDRICDTDRFLTRLAQIIGMPTDAKVTA